VFDPRLLDTLEGYYSAAIVARSYMSEEKFDGFGTGNIYTRKRKPNSAALDFSKSNPRQEMFMRACPTLRKAGGGETDHWMLRACTSGGSGPRKVGPAGDIVIELNEGLQLLRADFVNASYSGGF